MDLTIIIVNYNSARLTAECLESILRSGSKITYEIIVVDNASRSDDIAFLSSRFPFVQYLQAGYNSGFARANNAGIKKSIGNSVLLLNPDTIVNPGAIDYCYSQLMHSHAAAFGVQLLNEDGSPQMSGWHFRFLGMGVFIKLPYCKRIFDLIRRRPPLLAISKEEKFKKVDFINGAFLMVKRAAINSVGMLDEEFFLYSEEAEWCHRLNRFGPLYVVSEASVVHKQGEVANSAFDSQGKGYFNLFDKKGLQFMVSEWLRIRKQYGVGIMLLYFLVYLSFSAFFLLLWIADFFISFGKPDYRFQQYLAFVSNNFKCIPWIIKMVLSKPTFYKVL